MCEYNCMLQQALTGWILIKVFVLELWHVLLILIAVVNDQESSEEIFHNKLPFTSRSPPVPPDRLQPKWNFESKDVKA